MRRLRLDDAHRRAEDVVQVEELRLELELPRLDLGDVEDVIDEVEEVLTGHVGVLHVPPHLRRQLVRHGELQHAQHAVEGGAHLVRHRGEEVALGVVRGAHLGGVDLRLLDVLLLGDVLPDARYAHDLAAGVAARGGVEQQLDVAAVLGVHEELEVLAVDSLQRVVEDLSHRVAVGRVDEATLSKVHAQHLLLGVAREVGEVLVPFTDET